MERKQDLILIGGEGRNLGKTEFVCEIIRLLKKISSGSLNAESSSQAADLNKIEDQIISHLIQKESIDLNQSLTVIGLKIKTIREGEELQHGSPMIDMDRSCESENKTDSIRADQGSSPSEHLFSIKEDTNAAETEIVGKDSLRMKHAGADRVFRMRVQKENIHEAYEYFLNLIEDSPQPRLIVCESNTLREFYEPLLFIMIKYKENQHSAALSHTESLSHDQLLKKSHINVKPSAQRVSGFADLTIWSDEKQFFI
jgi:hypothetical protein